MSLLSPLLAAALAASLPALPGGEDQVLLREIKQGEAVLLRAWNRDPTAKRWIWVEAERLQGLRAEPGLPRGLALAPGEEKDVALLSPQGGSGWGYSLRSRSGIGDPTREPDPAATYLLPYEHGTKHLVSQGYFGRATHQQVRALDFMMPEGTKVCAAREGVVVEAKEDSWMSAPSALLAEEANRVQVQHADGTWATYAHLKPGGALVRPGARVWAGQPLGLSGETGMASGPHLHFAVYQATWDEPKTLATSFQTGLTFTSSLEEGRAYYAFHPGGAPFKAELAEALDEGELRRLTRTASGGKVSIREERVDRRNLVYVRNPTDKPVEVEVSLAQSQSVRPSVTLPYKAVVPPRTEAYCFWVDFVGSGESGYRLSARFRQKR